MSFNSCDRRKCFNTGQETIESSDSVVLLGINIDKILYLKTQLILALARISKYLSQDKIIMNTFIQSQSNDCPHLDVPLQNNK